MIFGFSVAAEKWENGKNEFSPFELMI